MRCVAFVLFALSSSAVWAQPTAPAYPFTAPPATILEQVTALDLGALPKWTDDERKFLAETWEIRARAKTPTEPGDPRIVEAVLLAGGVTDPAERKRYVDKLDAVTAAAKEATAAAKTPHERGDLLLKHLHQTTMKGGYDAKQSSLAVLLDGGKFNAVSATALCYVVGTRLGLDLRPIAVPGGFFVPGHAALDLLDGGKRIQVEPTGPDGFDYEAKQKKPGVTVPGATPDRKKATDLDPLGLAAMAYNNRGVEHVKAEPPRRLEALPSYLAALSLDPGNAAAANNLESLFLNWGAALLKEKKATEAIQVAGTGAKLKPTSRDLRENLILAWQRHIEATLEAGKDAEAVALVKKAAADVPGHGEFQTPAYAFEYLGWRLFREKGPEAALPLAERGLKLLAGKDATQLREWRSAVYRRWSQSLLDKKDIDGSLKVLGEAYKLDKADKEVHDGVAFHVQEALPLADKAGGVAAVTAHYQQAVKAFPDVAEVAEVAEAFVRRGTRTLCEQGKFDDALKRNEQYAALLPKPEQKADAAASVYDAWGRSLADQKMWEPALDKYAEGLKLHPGHKLLVNNAAVVVDRWADGPYKAKMYDEAIRIYKAGLKYLPDHPDLKFNLKVCEEKKNK